MVAAVTQNGEDEPVAVHRTYLAEPGRKADVEPAKAMLGPVKGGAVRLSDGPGPLVVAEGIETALSLLDVLVRHQPRVWAALSANGMRSVVLPAEPVDLVVAPDPDPTGWDAAEALATRARDEGRRVRILPSPEAGGDWNDAAMRRIGA
ncbi:MAG: toprim domain-containing protein [Pseudomonadota bacterium]